MLSQDTACQRLTPKGRSLGLIKKEVYEAYQEQEHQYKEFLNDITKIKTIQNSKPTTGRELLKRTDLSLKEIKQLLKISTNNEGFFERAANEIKYSGYIAKQQREVESSKKNERIQIPHDLDYPNIKGLSNEVIEKLVTHKPSTLGQATRLEGVTPAAVNLIAITIKKNQLFEKA
jgi:tRNA uridine 5-carboxymethylaminomethyl modification enzyme